MPVHQPKLRIPRIIHQIFMGGRPPKVAPDPTWSWTENNPRWDYRFWDDRNSRQFVKLRYPQYIGTFRRLIPLHRKMWHFARSRIRT